MRNYHDNLDMFIDKKAARDFKRHVSKILGQDDDLEIQEENMTGPQRRRK